MWMNVTFEKPIRIYDHCKNVLLFRNEIAIETKIDIITSWLRFAILFTSE
jgi:predicted ATP-grasp superfamily ATP-dependent carboligase